MEPPVSVPMLSGAWKAATLAALPPELRPSQLNVEVWRGRDGLPEGTVQSLAESRDGYLWIGTQRGAARFDGVRFTRFDMDNVPTMQANDVKAVLETADRFVWIAAAEGLTRYRDGQFAFFGAPQGLGLPYVHSLLEEPGCCLWVGTGGAGLWRLKDGRFAKALDARQTPDGNVSAIAAEPGVGLWLATRRGVLLVSPTGGAPRVFDTRDGLPAEWATKVLLDRAGRLWVGTRGGLARREGERFVTQPLGPAGPGDVAALAEDRDGSLWVGTQGRGLWRLRGGHAAVFDRWSGLPDDSVSALAEDRRGALWAGTTNGLVRLRAPRVTAWGRPEGLANEDVFSVATGDDVVLLGAQGDDRITEDDWAAATGTIAYEIVCGIGPRVPRSYD
jgi:ligand-binding sensor domain-containing protein